jgi:hypothetical protein
MIIIISVKKLTRQEKRLIKKNYSLLQYNRSHQYKKYDKIGKADILLFELDIGFLSNYNNNHVVKYLHSQDLKNIQVVFLYDNEKYRTIFNNVNHLIRKLPLFKGKTLINEVEKQEKKEIEEMKKKEKDKKELDPKEIKIMQLKNQIEILQKSLDKLLKPEPSTSFQGVTDPLRALEPQETKEKYELEIQKDCVIIKSGSEIIENVSYKNRIEKRHAIHQFQNKYNLN